MNYKISVIVPVYNVQDYLAQCLDSIIEQTLEDIEIICINDGSTDMSKEILDEYAKKDSRIILVNKCNQGYGATCNAGLRLARGEFISIIEPDDFIDKNMYKDLYELAVNNNAQIVKSAFYEYTDKNSKTSESINKINWSKEYQMPQNVFKLKEHPQFLYFHPSIWSCIYSKKFISDNNFKFVEAKGAGWVDNPFQVQTLCMAQRIIYTDNAYYYYRLSNPNSSSNIVNITNPFDRSSEIHDFLRAKRIKDKNLMVFLYKRELGYVDKVLGGIKEDLFDYASFKIRELVLRMDKKVIENSKQINDYERWSFEQCRSRAGVENVMKSVKERSKNNTYIVSHAF